LREHMLLVKA